MSRSAKKRSVTFLGPLERIFDSRPVGGSVVGEYCLGETDLVGRRKTHDSVRLNCAYSRLVGGGDDKIREAPPLEFGGAFQERMHLLRKPCFQSSSARGGGLCGHERHVRHIAVYVNRPLCRQSRDFSAEQVNSAARLR